MKNLQINKTHCDFNDVIILTFGENVPLDQIEGYCKHIQTFFPNNQIIANTEGFLTKIDVIGREVLI